MFGLDVVRTRSDQPVVDSPRLGHTDAKERVGGCRLERKAHRIQSGFASATALRNGMRRETGKYDAARIQSQRNLDGTLAIANCRSWTAHARAVSADFNAWARFVRPLRAFPRCARVAGSTRRPAFRRAIVATRAARPFRVAAHTTRRRAPTNSAIARRPLAVSATSLSAFARRGSNTHACVTGTARVSCEGSSRCGRPSSSWRSSAAGVRRLRCTAGAGSNVACAGGSLRTDRLRPAPE